MLETLCSKCFNGQPAKFCERCAKRAVDERLSFGEIAEIISGLETDLRIKLATAFSFSRPMMKEHRENAGAFYNLCKVPKCKHCGAFCLEPNPDRTVSNRYEFCSLFCLESDARKQEFIDSCNSEESK